MGSACSAAGESERSKEQQAAARIQQRDALSGKYAAPKTEYEPLLVACHGPAPKARKGHTVVNVEEHSLFFYGGFSTVEDTPKDPQVVRQGKDQPAVSDLVFHFAPRELKWKNVGFAGDDVPSARGSHCAVYYEGAMYVIGSHNQKDGALYQFRCAFSRWSSVETTGYAPEPLTGSSACIAGDLLLLFGGDNGKNVTNTLYGYEFQTTTWHIIEDARNQVKLLPRRDHTAVVFEDKMLVFGGFSHVSDELDFLQFCATVKAWQPVQVSDACVKPEKRGGHCCALYHQFMIIFGGMHHRDFLNDMWVFDVYTGAWYPVVFEGPAKLLVPAKRAFAASTICGKYMYIHGGMDNECYFRDFFRIDCNEVAKYSDPSFVPPTVPRGDIDPETGKPKVLEVGDKGYNQFNVKHFSPLWNDVVNRSTRVVVDQ